jgi:hypothetical protein
MDFSKLKLVTEMLAQGTGTSLATAANNKATQQSQGGKQMSNTSNNIGMQQAQMAQKAKGTGPTMDSRVQKNLGAPNPSPNATGTQAIVSGDNYFDALRARKEFFRKLDETKHDWRKDLQEALGKDDEVFHPYVEVMPMKDFKQKEAKKNLKRQALEPGSADNPAQKMVKGQMMGMGEEYVDERVYMQPHGDERKAEEKEKKQKHAEAAKAAARHTRLTKGIPGFDAKGKYYLKDGKKVYEKAD